MLGSLMVYLSRQSQINELFPEEPSFRLRQIEEVLFQPAVNGWNDVTTLPLAMREKLHEEVPFQSLELIKMQESSNKDTYKAVVKVLGGEIETVLMQNRRGHWSICVSSQIGCAMACTFCATGKMGLIRQLDSDEIVDQFRFWQRFLLDRPELAQRISNIVYMGMGEPLANYENVKESINTILAHTDIGKTRITVSTVGILPRLEQVLNDSDWPHVRMAISLHSADPKTRKEIVPTSYDDFLPKLTNWSRRYLHKFGNRRHHLTFEYVMLSKVNDTPHHATLLAKFVKSIGNVRVNLIPYNFTGCEFTCSTTTDLDQFKQ
ncbi:MAG: 23S rRNA (adenine(2503)-C(2))-methyltransferase RlmN, partial [bacterium]|nr:23S rRNA (adenine(2503)-C(2))-methyltransferase RlmN [bacterium]